MTHATVLVASHGVYWIAGEDPPTVVNLARADGTERWRTDLDDPWTRRIFASEDALIVSTDHNGRVPLMLAADTGKVRDGPDESGHDFNDERFYRGGTIYGAAEIGGLIEARALDDSGSSWVSGLPGGCTPSRVAQIASTST